MTDLVEGNTKSRLFRFMLPLLAGNFLQQCYSFADGVIVGSAIVKLCEIYGEDCVPYVGEYVKSMKDAIR